MKEKITVVITTYNLESCIANCLDEILNQTFQDFNIIVADDCSTDSTRVIIDNYKKHYERISTIYAPKNNGTPAALRGQALNSEYMLGDYVLFLDGDDDFELDMLEKLYTAAVNKSADIVCCAFNRVDFKTKKEYSIEMQNFYVKEINADSNIEYIPFVSPSFWSKLYSRKLIENETIKSIKVGEDVAFALKAFQKAKKIVFIDDIIVHYNVTDVSMMNSITFEQIKIFSDEFVNLYQKATNEYKNMLVLSAFIHIGISMNSRAYQSKYINTRQQLKWTKKYFNKNFTGWFKCKSLKLCFLKNFGIKGVAIWCCKILLKINCLRIFLLAYSFMINVLHKDVKW